MAGAGSDFTYAAVSCRAERTFRTFRLPPFVVDFFAIRYSIELYPVPGTAFREALVARLPWQDRGYATELAHAGVGQIRKQLLVAYDVECGTLAEVLFLRLGRQGDAEELAGPHLKLPKDFYADYYREQRRRLASKGSRLRL